MTNQGQEVVGGQLIGGRYRILGLLGEGGFARVYRARDEQLDRPVALKILLDHEAFPISLEVRFEREARILVGLSHPNVVFSLGHGTEGELRYLVMELAEGELLRARIDRGGIPWEEGVEIAYQVLDGIAHAHHRGIVHRDIKPTNLVLSQRDGGPFIKILDFGFARDVAATQEDRELAARGMALGTPGYLAPERLSGLPDGTASDVYSVGVLLFEMLAGHEPFCGDDQTRMRAHLNEPVPDVREARPEVPAALGTILRKAMAKDPAERYPDAAAMREALGAVRRVRPAAGVRPRRPARGRLWLVAAAAATLLVLGTATVGAWTGAGEQRAETEKREAAERETHARRR